VGRASEGADESAEVGEGADCFDCVCGVGEGDVLVDALEADGSDGDQRDGNSGGDESDEGAGVAKDEDDDEWKYKGEFEEAEGEDGASGEFAVAEELVEAEDGDEYEEGCVLTIDEEDECWGEGERGKDWEAGEMATEKDGGNEEAGEAARSPKCEGGDLGEITERDEEEQLIRGMVEVAAGADGGGMKDVLEVQAVQIGQVVTGEDARSVEDGKSAGLCKSRSMEAEGKEDGVEGGEDAEDECG